MATYASLRATAQRLIQKNGRTVTYTIKGTTLADPAKPWDGKTGDTTKSLKAAFIQFTLENVRGNLVQSGDKRALIAADDLATTPGPEDLITDGTIPWHIVSVEAIDPSDAPVVYDFHLRA
jgi:hypothetical protein